MGLGLTYAQSKTYSVYSDPQECKNLIPVAWDKNSQIFAISHLCATPEWTIPCSARRVCLQPDTLAMKHPSCVTIKVAEPTPCAVSASSREAMAAFLERNKGQTPSCKSVCGKGGDRENHRPRTKGLPA